MQVKNFYDGIAVDYQDLRYGSEYYRKVAQLELNFIQKYLKEGSCLEVGAGTGRATEFLLANVKEVLAVDISPRMLEQLKNSLPNSKGLATKTHDIRDLNMIVGYGNFDFSVCLRVLPHIEDTISALKQLRGAVTKHGIVVFDMWNVWGYNAIAKRFKLRPTAVYTHYKTIREMQNIIAKSELLIIDRKGFGFPPFKVSLPIENSSLSWLDFVAQRILWVCRPQKNSDK